MCVVSMIMDHYGATWRQRQPYLPGLPPVLPSQQELDEFRRLLERAREYDKRNSEPHCELEDKKRALKALAEQLGIDISFIEEPA